MTKQGDYAEEDVAMRRMVAMSFALAMLAGAGGAAAQDPCLADGSANSAYSWGAWAFRGNMTDLLCNIIEHQKGDSTTFGLRDANRSSKIRHRHDRYVLRIPGDTGEWYRLGVKTSGGFSGAFFYAEEMGKQARDVSAITETGTGTYTGVAFGMAGTSAFSAGDKVVPTYLKNGLIGGNGIIGIDLYQGATARDAVSGKVELTYDFSDDTLTGTFSDLVRETGTLGDISFDQSDVDLWFSNTDSSDSIPRAVGGTYTGEPNTGVHVDLGFVADQESYTAPGSGPPDL